MRRDALGGDLFCSLMAAFNFQLPLESLRSVSSGGLLAACRQRRPL